MLAKINRITNLQAALIIATEGFAVFFTGLTSPFQGDDQSQIVVNPVVHSLSNINLFFEGGTFYNGQGIAPLEGEYYRPLMTVVFSMLYTLFGPHTLAFHLFQLLIYIGSAVLFFLLLRYTFGQLLSLVLAIIFLVHPLNSQVVFAIPSMQDVLFFFFGVLSLLIILKYKSIKSLWVAALCILLSLLSKETGIAFILLVLLYLFWFNRERLYKFMGILILPILVYVSLRLSAVHVNGYSKIAPIDNINLAGRIFTAPSEILFYISKFLFPWKLASGYYWVYSTFSFHFVLLPLLIDIVIVGIFIYIGVILKSKVPKAQYLTFLFFAFWGVIGLIPYLQLIPLDMTASETWFYFSMAGVIGMIGVILEAFRIKTKYIFIVGVAIVAILGVRTAVRGLNWDNSTSMAYMNVVNSPEDYNAYNTISNSLIHQGNFIAAEPYIKHSIEIFPSWTNYNSFGLVLTNLGEYPAAEQAYEDGLKYGSSSIIYENLSRLAIENGKSKSNKQLILSAINNFPRDPNLWMYLAIYDDEFNDDPGAKTAITKAVSYGQIPNSLYIDIINNKPFTLAFGVNGRHIEIR